MRTVTAILICGFITSAFLLVTTEILGVNEPSARSWANLLKVQAVNTIQFGDEDGHFVGTLIFDKEGIRFEGDVDESAKIFFEHLIKNYMEVYYKQLREAGQ